MRAQREIGWFLETFGDRIEAATEGTPFTVAMFAGIAFQETGYLWPRIRKHTAGQGEEAFLEACVGDIIGAPRRKAFPRTPQDLKAVSDGAKMYGIAREALEILGKIAPEYAKYVPYEKRFCRGYGLFQYDLQFFKTDPAYFLEKKWTRFEGTFGKALAVATQKARREGLDLDRKLTIDESTVVAIAYNRGSYNESKGLKQGHKNSAGEYYGELANRYIKLATRLLAAKVPSSPGLRAQPGPEAGAAEAPARQPASPLGPYMVNARSGLIVRSDASRDSTRLSAVATGEIVQVLGFAGAQQDWALVDLEGDGLADGFMAAAFLIRA